LGDRLRLEVAEGSLGRVISAVEAAQGRVLSVQPVRQSLEDYFIGVVTPASAAEAPAAAASVAAEPATRRL